MKEQAVDMLDGRLVNYDADVIVFDSELRTNLGWR